MDLILREIAHPYLVKLVDELNQTAHLAIREGNEALYIDKVEGPKTLQMCSRVGMRIPHIASRSGENSSGLFLEEDVDRYLKEVELIPRTPNTIVSPAQLKEELLSIRERC